VRKRTKIRREKRLRAALEKLSGNGGINKQEEEGMKINVDVKPSEIEGLAGDMMSGELLSRLSGGTKNLGDKIMLRVLERLNQMDEECDAARPYIERYFGTEIREEEGEEEDEDGLFFNE
jgi:hypothetical protein